MTNKEKLEVFSQILRFRTISSQPGSSSDMQPFKKLREFLRSAFPVTHRMFKREVIGGGSLLFSLEGRNPGLEPVLLTAHMDVVPADDENWSVDPFSGSISEGRITSRGTVDYKVGLAGQLQACEDLLSNGFIPERSIILAYGHDEEVGGAEGAALIVNVLSGRNVRLRSVLDEGGYIFSLPWLREDIALIGLAEKGYLTLRFKTRGDQGHASAPGTSTAAGKLCACLADLEANQMPRRLCRPVEEMFESTSYLFDETVLDDISLEGVLPIVEEWPVGNAFVRTTTALTMLSGSAKENIIPGEPWALVNFRAVPGDSSRRILDHARNIAGPYGVEVDYEDLGQVYEPSEVSSSETAEYNAIGEIVSRLWPGVPVVPGIFPAATDSRHYGRISDNVYRFVPVHLGVRGLGSLHSENESITVEDYLNSVEFYRSYISSICGQKQ